MMPQLLLQEVEPPVLVSSLFPSKVPLPFSPSSREYSPLSSECSEPELADRGSALALPGIRLDDYR